MKLKKMINKFRILTMFFVFVGLMGMTAEKATDLMSEAIKSKASGHLGDAIVQLKKAVEASENKMQKSLALFMLGDCQIEMNHLTNAAETFNQVLQNVDGKDEKAEALYRLLQVETMRNRTKSAQKHFLQLKKLHKNSPYFELAQSYLKARGIAAEVAQTTSVGRVAAPKKAETVSHVKPAEKAEIKKELKKPNPVKPDKQAVHATPKPSEKEKPARPVAKPEPTSDKTVVSVETATILKNVLTIHSQSDKEDLISQILLLQDELKKNQGTSKADATIYKVAAKTAEFGELLEACKLYDRILNEYPSSEYVEDAYYQAIRLRAILGVHQAVVSWSSAFLAAFPASQYIDQVKALLFYSRNQGKVDLENARATSASTSSKRVIDQSMALKKDPRYAQVTRKMKAGNYNLALADLRMLEKDYSKASQLWWDKALIYVQAENFKQAEIAVKKMLHIDPDNEEGNSLLGYIQYRLEDYKGAAGSYNRAGESKGQGVNFFDGKRAAERLEKID